MKKTKPQAGADTGFLALPSCFLRFKYLARRFRFSTLLYCLPILSLYIADSIRLPHAIMKTRFPRFNTYLLVLALGVGCHSLARKQASTLRLHLEVNADGTDRNAPVTVGRNEMAFQVNVENEPFLKERNIKQASVVDAMGSFAIMVQYDRRGTWLLEQYSAANKGKRIAIMSQFGQVRWLAAPKFTQRIADGTLVFTPDATREEAERIVKGLNDVAKEIQKDNR